MHVARHVCSVIPLPYFVISSYSPSYQVIFMNLFFFFFKFSFGGNCHAVAILSVDLTKVIINSQVLVSILDIPCC